MSATATSAGTFKIGGDKFVVKAQVGSELPVEPENERWFPLWGIPI